MNYYVRIALVVCVCLALTTAQFAPYSAGPYGFLGSSFGGNNFNTLSSRDPRSNTGPVLFPPSPPGDPSQTSGVVVGASGFGFVPPGTQGIRTGPPTYYYPGRFFGR